MAESKLSFKNLNIGMLFGAVIEKGPQDWQIIQQRDGYGRIEMEGSWYLREQAESSEVYARVLEENTGRNIIPWKKAKTDAAGRWKIEIARIPAGGLYRIETCVRTGATTSMEWAVRGDMRHYIGVGDLFVIAGQSNSAGYGKDPVADEPELGVHLLKNSGCWGLAVHPLNDSTDTVHEVNREDANSGHSPYLSFAKTLKKKTGYPIGLIQTALGGSPIARWTPGEIGDLYENMIRHISEQPEGVRGILWYQGCSDTGVEDADLYEERFRKMVAYVRKQSGQAELPFITVQLNRMVSSPASAQEDRNWGKIRQAQRNLAGTVPGVYMIPSWDGTCMSDSIHNSSAFNLVLGDRMAYMAWEKIYGHPCQCEAPDLYSMRREGKKVIMQFAPVYDSLYMFEMPVEKLPFQIEDEKGSVKIIGYSVENDNTIVLETERETAGKWTVECGMVQNPDCVIPIDTGTHYPIVAFCETVENYN